MLPPASRRPLFTPREYRGWLKRGALFLGAAMGIATAAPPPTDEVVSLHSFEVTAASDAAPAGIGYTGVFLDEQNITTLDGLAAFAPGVFIQEKSPAEATISVRGIASEDGDRHGSSRVDLVQDGITVGRGGPVSTALFDLARVDVLRGPQPTAFGRAAEAGAISLVSQRPLNDNAAALTVAAGSDRHRAVRGFINTPLVPEKLLARLAFFATRSDGYLQNTAGGPALNGDATTALRLSLRWRPQPRTTVDVIGQWQHDTPPGTAYKSSVIAPPSGDTSPFTPAALNRGGALGLDRTLRSVTGIVTHALTPAWQISSTTGWREADSRRDFDADGAPLALVELTDRLSGRQFSQDLRLEHRGGGAFGGLVALGFFHDDGAQRLTLHADERALWPFFAAPMRDRLVAQGVPVALASAAIPAIDPTQPVERLPASFALFNQPALPPSLRALAPLAGAPLHAHNPESYINAYGVQALDLTLDGTWRATPQLTFTAGLRGTQEEVSAGYEVVNAPVPSTIGFVLGATPNTVFAPTPGKLEHSRRAVSWSGRVDARWDFTPALAAFASASRGRRPPGFVIDAVTTTPFREEVLYNYEAGLKGGLEARRLQWSASVFRYVYRGFQTMAFDPVNPFRFIPRDAGGATGRGVEANLRGKITDCFTWSAAYGYTDASFDPTGANGEPQAYAGYTPRLTPRHTFTATATVLAPLAGRGTIFVSPVYEYKSGYYFNDNNALLAYGLHQGGYSLVHLHAGWRSATERWSVAVHGENIFNRRYLLDAGGVGLIYNLPAFVAAAPRRWRVEMTRHF